jgi:hypothetical protein
VNAITSHKIVRRFHDVQLNHTIKQKSPPLPRTLPTKKNPKRRKQNLDLSIVDHAIYKELHKKEKEKIKEKRKLLSRTIYYL